MSSKAVALTMGDSCYQASDKTTMLQRQVTWGSRLMYLIGLLVCLSFVWYVAKLQTEVTVMKSQLEENTRQIAKLHYLCQEHAATSDNSNDLDDEVVDESTEEDSNEEDKLDIEVELEFEPSLGESELQTLGVLEIADRLAGDIADNKDRDRMTKRAKRNSNVQEESTPSPGKTKSRSERKNNKGGNRKDTRLGEDGTTKKHKNKDCKRSCKHKKDCCGHCKEEKTPVASAHFVGDADTVASVNRDQTNPAMAKVGGLISHWRHADWMHQPQRTMFNLSMDGNVTVQKAGIYFIYSQVMYYDDKHPFVGHSVYVNDHRFLTCTECVTDKYLKYNTCYIGGVTRIEANSTVGIKMGYEQCTINLAPDATYFGVVGLGE